MSLAINTSKIVTLCPEEYRRFSEAYDKFTDPEWATDSGMPIAKSLKFVCDCVANGNNIDGKLGQNLKESIEAVIRALDRNGIHGVIPEAVINLEMKGVTIRFTLPEATVFTLVLTEEGKRIIKALDSTEADIENTDCRLAEYFFLF